MPGRLSRRAMSEYIAVGLIEGQSRKKLFTQLAGYLVAAKRTDELDLIVRDIEFSLCEKGFVQAAVTSAFDLTAETKKSLELFVTQHTNARQVSLSSMIDPLLLGGVKIAIPGRELDQTAAHQLTVLKTRLRKV